ncbi:MAG: hypothetical protein K8M05_26570 [Deltaproteobacteria bacterium]|nr:hypothetical protein [Kofleriaceae bacterium]
MSDEDFPYLAEDRRKFRKQVAVSVVAVILGLGIVVAKCVKWRAEERARFPQMAVDHRLGNGAVHPTVPANVADAPAVELELIRGASRQDVVGAAIALGDGRTLEVTARPRWSHAGAELSLSYASSLRLTERDGAILLGGGDAFATLELVESDLNEAEGLADMARTYEGTGQVATSASTTMSLLGREVSGRRIHTLPGPVVEVAAAAAGKGKQLRVVITATSASADPSVVREAVQTVARAPRKPTPELDVTLRGAGGGAIATAEVTLGQPFELAGETVTIAWRETVRQARGGMRFEHPRGLTVVSVGGAAPSVSLQAGEIGIQVTISPLAIAPYELKDALDATLADATAFTRTIGNRTYHGVVGNLQMGAVVLHTQAFTFQRGGRQFIVMIQSPAAQAEHASALAEPVIASVQ